MRKQHSLSSQIKDRVKGYASARLHLPYGTDQLPASLVRHLDKGRPIVIADIGAHDGAFTAAINDYCGISRGLLVEPLPHKAATLSQEFQSPKFTVFECVASAQSGMVEFEINEHEATSSLLSLNRQLPELKGVNGGFQRTQCAAETLDELVSKANFGSLDLLKIDVQGAEHLVLEGASKVLTKTAMVWVEVSFRPLYHRSSTFSDIYMMMNRAAFTLAEIEPAFRSPQGELLQADVLFLNTAIANL